MDSSVNEDAHSASADAVSPPTDTQPSNDAGPICEGSREQCDNQEDDDCDGIVDECPAGQSCRNGDCIPADAGSCDYNLQCTDEDVCSANSCQSFRPSQCGDAPVCTGTTQCSTVDVCGDQPTCLGTLSAACNGACDCTGTLICREADGRCVQCLHGGQCEADAPCSPNGLCMRPVTLNANDRESLISELLDTLDECLLVAQGRMALGCAQLVWDGDVDNAPETLRPEDILDPNICTALSDVTTPRNERLAAGLGCNNAQRRIHWSEVLNLRSNPIGCLSYLPYWHPPGSTSEVSWRITLAPCNTSP